MPAERIEDEGQTLDSPTGKILGIVETKAALDALAAAFKTAGFEKVHYLSGDDGVALLERVDQFFFSDMEDRILARHIAELKAGHYTVAIDAPSDRIEEATSLATRHGATRLVHFGLMTVSWLTK